MGDEPSDSNKRPGGVKRSAASADAGLEQGKRRAAYIPRACDNCRKRKGRCDGARPCRFCHGRRQHCTYSMTMSDWRSVQSATHDDLASHQPKDPAWMQDAISSLSSLVMNLQQQVESLHARIGQADNRPATDLTTTVARLPTDCGEQADQSSLGSGGNAHDDQAEQRSTDSGSAVEHDTFIKYRPIGSFFGPTSPDFSLNMAQKQSCIEKASQDADRVPFDLPSIGEEQSDEDEENEPPESGDVPATRIARYAARDHGQTRRQPRPCLRSKGLSEIPESLSLRESLRLVRVYDEVVGSFHPILDIAVLAQHLEVLYQNDEDQSLRNNSSRSPKLDQDNLLLLNLVLSIALFAENTPSEAKLGRRIFHACQEAINFRLMTTPSKLNHVVLALVTGLCYFFDGAAQSAWRICGIAGSMLMELGLHNRDVAQKVLCSERMRVDAANITCSIIVLDRQWSSATGLPAHFRESTFEQNFQEAVTNPYLKAMMAFLLISDKVTGAISAALQGESAEDDNAIEMVNFQILEWRSSAIKIHAPRLLEYGYSASSQAPSWAVLLSLRANSVRSMLLRPYFFPNSNAPIAQQSLHAAMDIISDTINTLAILDKATDIYRKQHPYYQHILAGACALLSLVVSSARQSRVKLNADVSGSVVTSIRNNYWSAVSLASIYSVSSRMSRRLLRRLELMKQPLTSLGILNMTDNVTVHQHTDTAGMRQPDRRHNPQEQQEEHQLHQPLATLAAVSAARQQQAELQPAASQSQRAAGSSTPTYPMNIGPLPADLIIDDPFLASPSLQIALGEDTAWFMDNNLLDAGTSIGLPYGQSFMSGMDDMFAWGPF